MKKICLVWLILLAVSVNSVPSQISFQGVLKDSAGSPITGIRTIGFAICSTATGAGSLWSETQSVSVEAGLYNVQLGSVTPLTGSIFDGSTRYLAVTIGGSELSPRTVILTVPYAFKAEKADSATYADTAGSSGGIPNSVLFNPSSKQTTIEPTAIWVSSSASGTGNTNMKAVISAEASGGQYNAAVSGMASNPGATAGSIGVIGASVAASGANNVGVFGYSVGTGTSGVMGQSAGRGYGVHGRAAATGGIGVYGIGEAAGGSFEVTSGTLGGIGAFGYSTSQFGKGLWGISTADNGKGVLGHASGINGNGVEGYASGSSGAGVYGYAGSNALIGVRGQATLAGGIGVSGKGDVLGGTFEATGASGTGLYGYGQEIGVEGKGNGRGVFGSATASNGWGVFGEATDVSGGNIGGYFIGRGTSGYGVYGYATNVSGTNYGIYGQTDSLSGYAGYFVGGKGVRITADSSDPGAALEGTLFFNTTTHSLEVYADGAWRPLRY